MCVCVYDGAAVCRVWLRVQYLQEKKKKFLSQRLIYDLCIDSMTRLDISLPSTSRVSFACTRYNVQCTMQLHKT